MNLVIDNFVISFVTVTLIITINFWTTKNITGRLMVGLRWWNDISEDGKSTWRFETLPDKEKDRLDHTDSAVFWCGIIIEPLFWIACLITAFFQMPPELDWASLVFIAIVLSVVNFAGYVKCARGARKAIRRAATKKATEVATQAIIEQATSA